MPRYASTPSSTLNARLADRAAARMEHLRRKSLMTASLNVYPTPTAPSKPTITLAPAAEDLESTAAIASSAPKSPLVVDPAPNMDDDRPPLSPVVAAIASAHAKAAAAAAASKPPPPVPPKDLSRPTKALLATHVRQRSSSPNRSRGGERPMW
ncbi:hypothetical protein HDU96_000890 [Phlyctochytrium bullatum]|nr:hypothetical protein HDU96_000890 [Phlyctochytrium bullatum]